MGRFFGGEGDSSSVSGQLSSRIVNIWSNQYAFVALKEEETVVTWGVSSYGGDSSKILTYTGSDSLTDIVEIYSTSSLFVGIRADGSYIVWGSYEF